MPKLYECLMCGFKHAYEGTWRHVAENHVNSYYIPWRCSCGRLFRSIGDVNRHMQRTRCEIVYAPEETFPDHTKIAFKKLIARAPKEENSAPKPACVPTPLVEQISDDELDYEDIPSFLLSPDLKPGLIPLSKLDRQMEEEFELKSV